MTEQQLRRQLITAINIHISLTNKSLREARSLIKLGEYHKAQTVLTNLTTTHANLSLKIRSALTKHGYLESET